MFSFQYSIWAYLNYSLVNSFIKSWRLFFFLLTTVISSLLAYLSIVLDFLFIVIYIPVLTQTHQRKPDQEKNYLWHIVHARQLLLPLFL